MSERRPAAHVLLPTRCDNEFYNGDCDYGLIAITPELLRQIRSRARRLLAARREDPRLYEAYFWSHDLEFLADCKQLDALKDARDGRRARARLQEGDEAVLAGRPAIPDGAFQRIDCTQMILRTVGLAGGSWTAEVAFAACPKEIDVCVVTAPIEVAELRPMAALRHRRRRSA